MKLSRIYSNQPTSFRPLDFSDGLNVVLAEIRLPSNANKSSHNLGKSILARVIDFCCLGGCNKNHFFKKRLDLFGEFEFFLEIKLPNHQFLTIKRAVSTSSKVSFYLSNESEVDLSSIDDKMWTHFDLPMTKAQGLLDSYLDFTDISPWKFRNALGYFLRRQSDYGDVFKLDRHQGKDKYWKPVLAQVLGLDANLFEEKYNLKTDIEQLSTEISNAESQSGVSIDQLEKIAGLLQLRKSEAAKRQAELDEFNFDEVDEEETKLLVNEIDNQIADNNQHRYSITNKIAETKSALKEGHIIFQPSKAKVLFEEAGVLFPKQIKVDFDQLIAFNKSITKERIEYLKEELSELIASQENISKKLTELNQERSIKLAFLKDANIFEKYKGLAAIVSQLNADMIALERQQETLSNLQKSRVRLRKLKTRYSELQTEAEKHVRSVSSNPSSLLAIIKSYFAEIIKHVLGRDALLTVRVNDEGNLDFNADFVDKNQLSTSEGDGTSFKKLMCVAFDLAVLRAHINGNFPKFVYHDGLFEVLEPRRKKNLLEVVRQYSVYGIQSVITLIDADAPDAENIGENVFLDKEILLKLHDNGKQGRLFMFEGW